MGYAEDPLHQIRQRQVDELSPRDFQLSFRASQIRPEHFAEYSTFYFVAFDVSDEEPRPVDGDNDLFALRTRLVERFGSEFFKHVVVLGNPGLVAQES